MLSMVTISQNETSEYGLSLGKYLTAKYYCFERHYRIALWFLKNDLCCIVFGTHDNFDVLKFDNILSFKQSDTKLEALKKPRCCS